MKKNPLFSFLSLLMLLGMIISPLVPSSVLSAAPLPATQNQSPPAVAAKPASKEAMLLYTDNCRSETPAFLLCLSDGSLPGSSKMQVIKAGSGTVVDEGPSTPAAPNQLLIQTGDTLRVPFSITYIDKSVCANNNSVTLPNFRLVVNPLLGTPFSTVGSVQYQHMGAQPTMTFQDGVINYDTTTATVDTIFGYIDILVDGRDGLIDSVTIPGQSRSLFNFQLRSDSAIQCGSQAVKMDVVGPPYGVNSFSWRRPRFSGFATVWSATQPSLAELSVGKSTFIIDKITGSANFTYSVQITPAGTGITPTLNDAGTSNVCPASATAGQVITCDINNIGPLPTTLNAVTITLSVTGSVGGDAPITQTLTYTTAILHPGLSVTKSDPVPGTVYPPGSTISYTVTVTNTGGVPLNQFRILDTLGGDITSSFVTGSTPCFVPASTMLAPGALCVATYQYQLLPTDTNPLNNTVNVDAIFTPDTGGPKAITATTTYSVPIEAPDLELQFQNPVPDYAQVGGTIAGSLVLKNTGTVNINFNAPSDMKIYKLVNALDSTQILASGSLTGVPDTLPPGPTGNIVNPGYSFTVPPLLPSVTAVDLVIFIQGKSTAGVSVPRTLTKRLDVVRSNLRIKVTSDALNNTVVRGQTVKYTVQLQNISSITLTNIKLTGESLGVYPGGITNVVVNDLAPGASQTLPPTTGNFYPYTVQVTDNSPLIEQITATFGPTNEVATGQLTLLISDLQVRVNVFGQCQFTNQDVPTQQCSSNGEPIVNNSIQTPTTVRYFLLLTNTGTTRVTNVRACLGVLTSAECVSTDGRFIPLSANVLDPYQGNATGEKGKYYASFSLTLLTEYVSVFVTDQTGGEVAFRGSTTLSVVSANQYLTMTKDTLENKSVYYVGETINYHVKACYDGPSSSASVPLNNFHATDPLKGAPPADLISLTVTDLNGTPISGPGTSVTLNKDQCAVGTFAYVAQSASLDKLDQIDLTNTVTFAFSSTLPISSADRSFVITLKNPLKVTKIASKNGIDDLGATPTATGTGITYIYTLENLGPLPITGITSIDRFGAPPNEKVNYRNFCDVNPDNVLDGNDPTFPTTLAAAGSPSAKATVKCTTFAFGAKGQSLSATGSWQNTLTATGVVSGITVTAQKAATLSTYTDLRVTKTANPPLVYIYDPPITYSVVIMNNADAATGIHYQLMDASDSLNGSLIRMGDPPSSSNYSIDGTTFGTKVTSTGVPIGGPLMLKNVDLAPQEYFRIQYQITPAIALTKREGLGGTNNTFTLKARLSHAVSTTLADLEEYHVQLEAKATVTVDAPLSGNVCTKNNEDYIAWGEKPVFQIDLSVANSPTSPSSITFTTMQLILDGQTYDVSGGLTTIGPGTSKTIIFTLPNAVPWDTKTTTYDGSSLYVRFTQTPQPPATGQPFLWYGYFKLCDGRTVGPPVVLTKKASPTAGDVGTVITYSIKAENKSFHTTVSELDLTDAKVRFGVGIPLKDSTGAVVTSLAPGKSAAADDFPYTLKATDDIPFVNIAELKGKAQVDAGSINNFPTPLQAKATVTLPSPDLQIVLTTHDSSGNPKTSFNVGDTVYYRASIVNRSTHALKLKTASVQEVTPAPIAGFTPQDGLDAWIATRGSDTIQPCVSPCTPERIEGSANAGMYRIAAPNTFALVPPQYTFTSNLNIVYAPVVDTPTDQTSKASATIDLNNPNLQVTIRNQTNGVATYGTVIVYDVRITNPATSGVDIYNLQATENPVFGLSTDLWYRNGQGTGVLTSDLPLVTAKGTGTPLAPGDYFSRTVRHEVTTSDFSPIVYTVTATGQYDSVGGPVDVQDVRSSSVIISDSQLRADVSLLLPEMTANASNKIDITYTNIGTLAVDQMTVTVIAEDANGVAVPLAPISYSATCVLSPSVADTTTQALCSQLPPVAAPQFQLSVLDSTFTSYTFKTPLVPSQFAGLPNPLVFKFVASGITQDGLPFESVITRVPVRLLQSALVRVSETPDVSAAPIGGTVNYTITVQNLSGTDALDVTQVKDGLTGNNVTLNFPGGNGTTGTIPAGQSVTGTSAVVVGASFTNPFLHTTTMTGTQAGQPVSDSSFSQVKLLNTAINVDYTTPLSVVPTNTNVGFNLRVQNLSTKNITLVATDVNRASAITLYKDVARTQLLGTDPVLPGEFAYALNTVLMPSTIGPFTSRIKVDATDTDNNKFSTTREVTVNVVGVGLIFSVRPSVTPAFAKVGDIVTVNFTVKNGGQSAAENLDTMLARCVGVTCTLQPGFPTTLAANAEAAGSLTYMVQPLDTGTVTLNIQVTGHQVGTSNPPTVVSVSDVARFNVAVGNLVVTKTSNATNGSAKPGDTLTYTVRLENVGSTPLTINSITDTLGGTIPPGAAIAGGQFRNVTYNYTIPATTTGTLFNTVIVAFTDGTTAYTATAQASVNVLPTNATLLVRVTASPQQGKAFDSIVFSTEVTNNSTVDNLALPVNGTTSSLGLNMNVSGLLKIGETKVFTSDPYVIPVTASGTISNVVTVVSATPTIRGVGTALVTVISPSGLTVVKTADRQTAKAGDVIKYTVLITNTSTNPINLAGITDSLVSSVTGLPAGLNPGASTSITYNYTVGTGVPAGLLPNTVTVSGYLTDPNALFYASATVNVVITTGSSGLLITGLTSQASYTPGNVVIYNINVINTSAVAQSNIAATYTPTGSGAGATSITLSSSLLQPGEQATGVVSYATTGTSPDPLSLTLNVTGNPGPASTGITNTIPRNSGKTLTALMTASPAQVVAAGDIITYTLTVWNTSTNPVTSVTGAFDVAPKHNLGAPYTSGTALSQLASPTTQLAPGASRTVTFQYTVLAADLTKPTLNAALILTPNASTTETTSVSANAVTVGLPVSIALTSFNCTAVTEPGGSAPYCYLRPGTTITGTVKVDNNSTTTLTNLAISFNTSPVFTIPLTTAEQTLAAGGSLTKTFTWTVSATGIIPVTSPVTDQILMLNVSASATGLSQVSIPPTQQKALKFINPRLTINSVGLNSGYTSPVADLSDVQFKVSVTNASNTLNTSLSLVGKDSSNNNRLKVFLISSTGVSKEITSSVTVSSPTAPRANVVADLNYGAAATDVILNYKIQASDPNPFNIMVSAVACVKNVPECESGATATNGLNTSITQTAQSAAVTIQRAMLAIAESTSNPKTVNVGQPLALAFTISNPGAIALVNLQALDVTLNGTAIAEKLSLGSVTSIAAGGSTSATLTHTVLSTDPKTLQFLIRLTGNSGTTSGTAISASYTTQAVTVGDGSVAANGLAIAMAVDKSTSTNGSPAVFTITVSNTSAVPIQTIALTDTLPTTLTGATVKTDVGSAVISGSTMAASIGTLAAGQKATLTLNATISATAPATITNQACATSATNTTPICASASISLAPGSATNPVNTLPVAGIGGNDPSGMFLLLILSALLFLATTARTKGTGPVVLIVAGVIVAIIALALIFTIIRNANTRIVFNATNTALVAPTVVVAQRTNVSPPPRGTSTPLPDVTAGATLTPLPPGTLRPSVTPVPSGTPVPLLFQPVGDKSLYVPKLALPGAVPIIELPLKNETWDVSNLGQSVGHLEQTSWLGKTGNTVLVAHIQLNFREMGPFLKLSALAKGDQVMVYDKGAFYVYEVTDTKVVAPTDVQVTYPTTQPQLTLITCTVWDANRGVFAKRLVVTAKLVKTPDGSV